MALSDFETTGPMSPDPVRQKASIPKGWEPRAEYDVSGGYVVTKPREISNTDPDAATVFDAFGMDSEAWTITNLRRSTWQNHAGEWLESFRASFVPRTAASLEFDVEQLIEEVRRHKPAKKEPPRGDYAYVVPVGDTQIGKVDGGGTEVILRNTLTRIDQAVERLKDLRKLGYEVGEIVLPWLGDCIEGNQSQGGQAAAAGRIDLTVTQQVRVLRRLMVHQIKQFAPHAERIVVPIIPGNHDEAERRGGIVRSYTDSWAIEAGVAVQDVLAENPQAYGHVAFVFPKPDELTVTIDVKGTILGMAHGHQFGSDALRWWKEQQHGRQAVGEADILLGAHLHHLRIQDTGKDRVFMQVPALDGGSMWFRHKRGDDARAGMVSFLTMDGHWSELTVL